MDTQQIRYEFNKERVVHFLSSGLAVAMGVLALMFAPHAARADTVLYDSAGFVQGQQSFVQGFDLTSAGTVTVTLSNIPWLDTISGLDCFLSTASGAIGATMGPGTETFNVGPGMLYAHWFGNANGAFGLGVYGLNIAFQPTGTPVPLPTSLILLLSGLGMLWGWQRRPEAA
jgi:hypothetical protein